MVLELRDEDAQALENRSYSIPYRAVIIFLAELAFVITAIAGIIVIIISFKGATNAILWFAASEFTRVRFDVRLWYLQGFGTNCIKEEDYSPPPDSATERDSVITTPCARERTDAGIVSSALPDVAANARGCYTRQHNIPNKCHQCSFGPQREEQRLARNMSPSIRV